MRSVSEKTRRGQNYCGYILISILAICLFTSLCYADTWSSCVTTNSTRWCIERQSSNLNLFATGIVSGNISTIDINPVGRKLNGFFSRYANIKNKDVSVKQRTNAQKGHINYGEQMAFYSSIDGNVTIKINKPIGSPIFTFEHTEEWPTGFGSVRQIRYTGSNINDLDWAENNMDFEKTTLLYNKELSKDTRLRLILERMNATVLATNDGILRAEFKPTKLLDYSTRIHTTGIAALNYRMTGSVYDPHFQHPTYLPISGGEERYYGTYDIARNIVMNTTAIDTTLDVNYNKKEVDWLPCSLVGYFELPPSYRKAYGLDGVFDCTCYKAPQV